MIPDAAGALEKEPGAQLGCVREVLGKSPGFGSSGFPVPPRSWFEFKTYKRRFEQLRPLFAILAKRNLVPMSFYLKYCFPTKTM